MELEVLVLSLILGESIELELLENLVICDCVFSVWSVVTVATDVEKDLVEHVILEVDAVADSDIFP